MPRLLSNSERASIASIIDSISKYGSSWAEMIDVCKVSNIDLEHFTRL